MANMEQLRQQLETANAKHRSGDIATALPIYRSILNDWPNQPDALHMLGIIAQQMGNIPLALQLFEETTKVVPQFATAWVNRSIVLRQMDRNEEARQSVEQALKIDPKLASAWNMKGVLLRDERRYDEACTLHAKAVSLDPDNANLQQNYAAVLLSRGQIADAWQAIRIAEKLNPHRADTLTVLGNILVAAGYPERALSYYHKAQAADARYTDSIISEATTCLYMGDFVRGWELMETRRLYLHDPRCRSLQRWNGKRVDHLLVTAEQGAGDNIQAARYLPVLKSCVGQITLQVSEPLQRIMQFNFPDVNVITPKDPLPKVDAFEPIMSLAHHCPGQATPAPQSYMNADKSWREPWQEKLKYITNPRIGFVWAGNPQQVNDYNRSILFEYLRPLITVAGSHAIAMQKDGHSYDLSGFAFNAAPHLNDYADAAGLMDQLDLLITVDTSPAHLMGALGKPVWVMVPFDPGWRYMIGREDSPWYPAMRVFRQNVPGDWGSVVGQVEKELRKYMAGDLSVLKPQTWQGPFLRQHPQALPLAG